MESIATFLNPRHHGSHRGEDGSSVQSSMHFQLPTPNYINPVTRRKAMPGVCIPLMILSTATVAVRIWSRFSHQTGRFGIDDVFILGAWAVAMALSIGAIVAVENFGFDRHIWDVFPTELAPGAKLAWVGQVIFLVTTCLCKIGILLFYRRLTSGTTSKGLYYATWAGIVFTAFYGVVFIIVLCTTCKPLNAYWLSYSPTYNAPHICDHPGAGPPVSGALSVFSDLYAVVLPYLLVRKLQISWRQRCGLYMIFSFGLFVVGCGIARTVLLDKLSLRTFDVTWTSHDIFIASNLEAQLSVIGACLPNLRKLFGSFFGESPRSIYENMRIGSPKLFRSSKKSGASSAAASDPALNKRRMSIYKTEDIEMAVESVTSRSDYSRSRDKPLPKIYENRFSSASEENLSERTKSNISVAKSQWRNMKIPHTVF
ncbi:hypothetical protein EV356DRAFT_250624 [Viridothelium virens]|uniref:Rhodopsin domain-containing protein n=1 Tax=Viridothelium virens TaxID=1048519 RepID=A0A6A6H3S7_VIRVR|nr:hypothetical protein EV356DRAFT_250624 [Viridothelium virens]